MSDPDRQTRLAYERCAEVVRRRARNFWYGLRLTPEPKRSALYAIYAWMREADDLADEPGPTTEQRRTALQRFRDRTAPILDGAAPDGDEPMWLALADVVRRHELPADAFHEMIDGQILDLDWGACPDRATLDRFCELVASTVGRVCVAVWGHDGHPAVAEMVRRRGLALQQTNVLRDLREDRERGRVYLPADELDAAGLDIESIVAWRDPERCEAFVRTQVDLVEAHYEAASTLEGHLDPDARATSWAMVEIYHGLLRRIADAPGRLARDRVTLGRWRKVRIAWKARWQARGQARGQAGGQAGGQARERTPGQALDPTGRDDA